MISVTVIYKNNMNLIDAWVTKVQEKPYYEYDKWWVKVESVDEGGNGTSTLMFEQKHLLASARQAASSVC